MKFGIRHELQSGMCLWGLAEVVREELTSFQSSIDQEAWQEALASLERIRTLTYVTRRMANTLTVLRAEVT